MTPTPSRRRQRALEVLAGHDQLTLGADPLEEHDQLQREEDERINGGPTALGVEPPRPIVNEAKIQLHLEMALEVVLGNEVLQRDGD